MFGLALRLAVAAGTVYALTRVLAGRSLDVPGVVKRVEIDGREYEVFRRGGGTYEVVRHDEPENFIIFGQKGELSTRGDAATLAMMRSDMQRFPKDLFA